MKVRILCLVMGFVGALQAQVNLVPNGSFEDTLECIDFAGQISRLKFWSSATNGSPDAISSNFCNVYLNSDIIDNPLNTWGFQYPKSGNNYIGLGLYNFNEENFIEREYIQVPLIDTLKNGMFYCVKFYISLAEKVSSYAIRDIGIYFSPDSIYVFQDLPFLPILNYLPQIESTIIIEDTTNWVEVSGYFQANGEERYILIGNFSPQNDVDTLSIPNITMSLKGAYYYIDDVSVFECDSLIGIDENPSNNINIYPNPASDIITINTGTLQDVEIELFDIAGRKLLQQKVSDATSTIDVSGLANGVYICQVSSKGRIIKREKVIISK